MAEELDKLKQNMGANFLIGLDLSEKQQNAQDIDQILGHPARLVYPAGGHDMFKFMLPSAKAMAIIDLVPFLFDRSRPLYQNDYSHIIQTQLAAHKGQYVNLFDILTNPDMTTDRQNQLVAHVQAEAQEITRQLGYQINPIASSIQADKDNFAGILANLLIMGVDITTINTGMFDEDFRLQFTHNGIDKTLIYRQETVSFDFSAPGTPTANWAQHCFDGFPPGNTALLVAADPKHISQYVINAFNPDKIIGSGGAMAPIRNSFGGRYRFHPLPGVSYLNQRWGYNDMTGVTVGE